MALGKNHLTLKRWVKQELVPPPVHYDCVHDSAIYTEPEVKAICKELRKHERLYEYLTTKHTNTIEAIQRSVESVRDQA